MPRPQAPRARQHAVPQSETAPHAVSPADAARETWPTLSGPGWEDTRATLHLWTQIVGKTRLALSPRQNHWWHVALSVTARGLSTSAMPSGRRTVDIEFDFIDHQLIARASDGRFQALPLVPRTVADFYRQYQAVLSALDVPVRIWPQPVEIANPIRFPDDQVHGAYDANSAHRLWRLVVQVDRVLKAFRGRFLGKSSPVHFWWGGFDLAHTRFSGRPAPPHPGGIPNIADAVTREAYSHECTSVGWWPGGDGPIPEPAFYAYAYPEPSGYAAARIGPAGATYHPEMGEWILPYETVRRAPDPDAALLTFAQSTYEAAADLGGWDRAALERGLAGPRAANGPQRSRDG